MRFHFQLCSKILFLCVGMLCAINGWGADNVKDLQREQRNLQKQLEKTNKLLKNTKSNEKATLNKLQLLNKDISVRKKLITTMNNEIEALDVEMNTINKKQAVLQHNLDSVRRDYAKLIRISHHTRMQLSPLLFVLSSNSFLQFYRRMRYLKQFALYEQTRIEQIESIKAELAIQNQILQEDKRSRKTTLQQKKREQENLTRSEKKHQSMLKELQKQSKKLASQQQKQQKQIEALNKKIETLIAKQVTATAKETLSSEHQKLAKDFVSNKGKLPMPVANGVIIGQFGIHKHPLYPTVTLNNRGIFIQAPANSEVCSVFDGEVTSCFIVNKVYAIIVQHGNYRTVYTGISKPYIKTKDKVKARQKIGKIYFDAEADNKCELQFQVWKDREIQNPSIWLAKQ